MELQLHPRYAPPDRLRVWLGAIGVTAPPDLNWTIDGNAVDPTPLRPLQSARPANLLPPGNAARAFTGVFEFEGLTADTSHEIGVTSDDGAATPIRVRTVPDAVPEGLDQWFNVLLVSCFHWAEDTAGIAGTIAEQLNGTLQPHLTIMAGDQVYVDLPTLQNFPDDEVWLAKKFEDDYVRNWTDPNAYAKVLGLAPSLAIPDDHEYWNNYPNVSPFIQNSLTAAGRERWRVAARAGFDAFQLAAPANYGEPIIFEVPPLSFFLADTRSNKKIDRAFTLDQDAHQKLTGWVADLKASGKFGVFVSGQSLFREPVGTVSGNIGDFELPNYGDFGQLMETLADLAGAGRPLLCLTGDVHWGRVTAATDTYSGRKAAYEIISSPASLVSTVGLDQAKRLGAAIGGLFGHTNPWPRHSAPDAPPAFLASGALQGRFPCKEIHGQTGNQLVLLRFRQESGGIELRVSYWPANPDNRYNQPVYLDPITLKSN